MNLLSSHQFRPVRVHLACQNHEIGIGLFCVQYDLDTLNGGGFNKEAVWTSD
jgi:hypothetical protein